MSEALHIYAILTGNNDIQDQINKLKSQQQSLQADNPEYQYDQFVIERDQIALQIRMENPNLDPQTLAGNAALNELMAEDPAYQAIAQKITNLCNTYPSECTSWGIPLDRQDATYIELN